MKLLEIVHLKESDFLTDKEEIIKWAAAWRLAYVNVEEDGTISCEDNINIINFSKERLMVKFSFVRGDFDISHSAHLNTMEGFPRIIRGSLTARWNDIKTFEHCPEFVRGDVILEHNPITSLIGISKHLKECHGTLRLTWDTIKEGGIEILNIKGVQLPHPILKPNPEWLEIIRKYEDRRDDIFECQAELIDRGYEEYARL